MARTGYTLNLSGFKGLEKNLSELPKAVQKKVVHQILLDALQPMLERIAELVPVDTGLLRQGLVLVPLKARTKDVRRNIYYRVLKSGGSKKAAASALKSVLRESKSQITWSEVGLRAEGEHSSLWHLMELGTSKMQPRPYILPAWQEHSKSVPDFIKAQLGNRIDMAAAKVAKNALNRARREAARALRSA